MWEFIKTGNPSSGRFKFRVRENNAFISHKRFLSLLKGSLHFITVYNKVLSDCGFEAFFWENKPVTHANLFETYECSLVNSNTLAGVSPNLRAFGSYFTGEKQVVSFPNLGGDATLIAPCPVANPDVYTHIGKFVREAPEDQISEFWKATAGKMMRHLRDEPKWLSTSGLGVYWLHARIDSTPKYYQTEEYKQV